MNAHERALAHIAGCRSCRKAAGTMARSAVARKQSAKMTPEARRARARLAAQKRWQKAAD